MRVSKQHDENNNMTLKTIQLLLTGLMISPMAMGSTTSVFVNPHQHYTGMQVGYGDGEFDLALQYARPLQHDWSLLSGYVTNHHFDRHHFSFEAQRGDGLGVLVAYLNDSDFDGRDIRAKELSIGSYYEMPISPILSFYPGGDLNKFRYREMSGSLYYARAHLDMVVDSQRNIWFGLKPEYNHSFGTLREKNGPNKKLRDWDVHAHLGFRLNSNSALVYRYQYDDGNNLSLFAYEGAF
ncbi:hypothetical protein FC652_08265 [Vibrio sp. 05-20-BW147]|uniref:hypothetical protein n=1 Tax=Vibrio sp. 05-20-BW147 TaxID=2575834 RepID=UPI001C3C79E5|nr:hypothetical protein [Vibrio sp. 05-20-BW147]NVC63126.1 hypothetical protein [Vibrio sp. 05-20-BW147]